MQNALISSQVSIQIANGHPVTTSLDVAQHFGRRHDHVVARIKTLGCSEQFLTSNFSGVPYEHNGNTYTMFQITKDGFMFLVMGFTGSKAAQIKEAYIHAFNAMEAELQKRTAPDYTHPDAIKAMEYRATLARWIASIKDGQMSMTPIPANAFVLTADEMPSLLEHAGITRDQTIAILEACVSKLKRTTEIRH